MTTPKQILVAHMEEFHKRQAGLPSFKRASYKALQTAHGHDHHRLSPNHYHVGVNRGVGERPAGWKTGEDAVLIERKSY